MLKASISHTLLEFMKRLTYSTESRKYQYSVWQNLYVYANQVYPYHIYEKNS